MIRIPKTILCAIACLLYCGQVSAHGETDKPLFVGPDGVDRGDCKDEREPCRTIGYALRFAGKGGQIRVAEGAYRIENTEDLFHIVSGLVDVQGARSTLTGVPHQYRELLEAKGFRVIADRKSIDGPKAAEAEKLFRLHAQLQAGAPAAPCVGGFTGGLRCDAVDLLSHVAFTDLSARPAAGNDVWGFVDLNTHREYVIAGFNTGTAVIDVTDPAVPLEVGFVDGQNSVWRDIKVHQFFDAADDRWKAYAYVTTDLANDGLVVIDLTGLPHSIRRAGYSSDFANAHNVYATNVDYATGIPRTSGVPHLIIAGSNVGGGRFRAYRLTDPSSPVFASSAGSSDYMHDAASLVVTDGRKDTQCVNAGAFCEVLLDFNESTVDVWDITNAALPQRLSRTPYANSGYTHSGWPTEDGQYMFVHDELDEQQFGFGTTLRVFSLADLTSPVAAGSWSGPTTAIDHNGFVRGNRYYMSNYSRGLTILDISDPTAPRDAGRLDTYPFSDSSSFVGAWGAYPFLWSGTVAISDIDSGLYLAADRTRDVAAGQLAFAAASAGVVEGQQLQLAVERTGGSSGNVSVAYEILAATADNSDYQLVPGLLSWAVGDIADKTIDITAINDGAAEGLERLIVRLVSPGGGATLGDAGTASVYIGDPGAQAEVAFRSASIDIAERGFGTAVVTLRRTGSVSGPVSVDYSMTAGDASAGADFQGSTSGTVSWANGDADPKSLQFAIVDDGAPEQSEFFELTLANAAGATIGQTASVTVNVHNGSGPNLAPNAVAGVSQTRNEGASVTLDGSQSSDPNGDVLTYQWAQTNGPTVGLIGASTAIARFTAPSVASDTMLQFRLTVTDPSGLGDSAVTTVTVLNAGGFANSNGGGPAGWLLLVLAAVALRRVSRRDVA